MLRMYLAIALFAASSLAHAQVSANGSESGTVTSSESDQSNSTPMSSHPIKRSVPNERKAIESAPESQRTSPRWHSFLPGMIR